MTVFHVVAYLAVGFGSAAVTAVLFESFDRMRDRRSGDRR